MDFLSVAMQDAYENAKLMAHRYLHRLPLALSPPLTSVTSFSSVPSSLLPSLLQVVFDRRKNESLTADFALIVSR